MCVCVSTALGEGDRSRVGGNVAIVRVHRWRLVLGIPVVGARDRIMAREIESLQD